MFDDHHYPWILPPASWLQRTGFRSALMMFDQSAIYLKRLVEAIRTLRPEGESSASNLDLQSCQAQLVVLFELSAQTIS